MTFLSRKCCCPSHRATPCLLLLLVSIVAIHLSSLDIPDGSNNPYGLRVAFGAWRFYVSIIEYVGWIFGIDNGYLFFKYTVVFAPPCLQGYGVQTQDTTFNGVPVRIYKPEGLLSEGNRGMVYYHGGGWSVGNLDLSESFCRRVANASKTIVVSVDYRLAPEHIFPEPLKDCVAATTYFLENAKQYDVDPERVVITGDSAGGNLAAAVALSLRDADVRPRPRAQVLLYPALQALDLHTPSYRRHAANAILTRDNMAGFWLLYAQGHTAGRAVVAAGNHTPPEVRESMRHGGPLGYLSAADRWSSRGGVAKHAGIPDVTGKPDQEKLFQSEAPQSNTGTTTTTEEEEEVWARLGGVITQPYFSPLLAETLRGLPPAFVFAAGHDVLRDDALLYAQRLEEAGNDVTLVHFHQGYHGLMSYPLPLADTDRAFDILTEYIDERL